MSELQALHIIVTGRVQGVGFRPFVNRIANQFGLAGWVRNRSGQVEIRVEGSDKILTAFTEALHNQAPPLAQPDYPVVSSVSPIGFSGFNIAKSEAEDNADIHIPPDFFVCDDCLTEMQNPLERRYRYPFINCTQCGPRYTLIDSLPYDRPNTAMANFKMCPNCRDEYCNPVDRRYHAQPLACCNCGPSLYYHRAKYPVINDNEKALASCIASLREGLIIAVKGVGGYHLICDASNSSAVNRLRKRKHRPHKPLAVLVPWKGKNGLELVDQLAVLSANEKQLLSSPLRPIVLLAKRVNSILSQSIAPGLNEVGLMLPYSPLHHLLANDYGSPMVATSANLAGEPVLTDEIEVETRLSQIADAFLHHNRPIRRPADDSVYRLISGKPRPIRLGRGYAPVERKLPFQLKQPILAIGADLKNTVALGFNDRVVVSPHIGDLGSPRSQQVFEQLIADLIQLYDINPQAIIYDAHPGYHSSRWAKRQERQTIAVFHHHAHASALAGEHELKGDSLVFTWDGTGLGEDNSLWGCEALLGSPGNWHRTCSIKPFSLPGGEKASREPWRSALSVCWELGLDWTDCPHDASLLRQAWEKDINCPKTSSAGRLFDAAAALIGIAHFSSYEGHAAMQLEAISTAGAEAIPLALSENSAGIIITDWAALIAFLMDKKVSPAQRGSVFHASLANIIVDQAMAIREKHKITQIGLSGGVFQNRLLTELAVSKLTKQGFQVYSHEAFPAGDGSISFGQIIEAGKTYV